MLFSHIFRFLSIYTGIFSYTQCPIISSNSISTIHMLETIKTALDYYANPHDDIAIYGIYRTLAYFGLDTLHVIFTNLRKEWYYIPHHILSIIIASCVVTKHISFQTIGPFIMYLELSNLFIPFWVMTKNNKKINYWITPLMSIIYIPIRTLVVPIIVIPLIKEALLLNNNYLTNTLLFSYGSIVALSLAFSYKIKCILQNQFNKYPNENLSIIFTTSNDKWFPIVTYIFKLYTTWYIYANHVIYMTDRPLYMNTFLALVDISHILVSWMFYISNYSEKWEKLDISFVQLKMTLTGLCICLAANKVNFLNIFNLLLTINRIRSIYATKGKLNIENNKNIVISSYLINFVISSSGLISLGNIYGYLSSSIYLIGGIMWALGIPEKSINNKITHNLNSLGWMHLCILAGDYFNIRNVEVFYNYKN